MITRRINPVNIPRMHEKREFNRKLQSKQVCQTVEDFIDSSMISIEVIDNEGLWANSNNFRRSFQQYVDSRRLRSRIIVTIRGNRVFLIKKGLR
jgi:hypothetical protein